MFTVVNTPGGLWGDSWALRLVAVIEAIKRESQQETTGAIVEGP